MSRDTVSLDVLRFNSGVNRAVLLAVDERTVSIRWFRATRAAGLDENSNVADEV
ncbi:hypothetical protein Hhis01_03524 [Haloarcula hispanica]